MKMLTRNFRFWSVLQLCIWGVVCSLWFYLRTASIFAHPTESEQYVYTWSFQAAMFCIFRLPFAVLALLALLALEWFMFFKNARDETHAAYPHEPSRYDVSSDR